MTDVTKTANCVRKPTLCCMKIAAITVMPAAKNHRFDLRVSLFFSLP